MLALPSKGNKGSQAGLVRPSNTSASYSLTVASPLAGMWLKGREAKGFCQEKDARGGGDSARPGRNNRQGMAGANALIRV